MSMADDGTNANRSPGFKNTMTLPELIEKLVARDAPDKDRAHAALALQYLSLNIDKVRFGAAGHAESRAACLARIVRSEKSCLQCVRGNTCSLHTCGMQYDFDNFLNFLTVDRPCQLYTCQRPFRV